MDNFLWCGTAISHSASENRK